MNTNMKASVLFNTLLWFPSGSSPRSLTCLESFYATWLLPTTLLSLHATLHFHYYSVAWNFLHSGQTNSLPKMLHSKPQDLRVGHVTWEWGIKVADLQVGYHLVLSQAFLLLNEGSIRVRVWERFEEVIVLALKMEKGAMMKEQGFSRNNKKFQNWMKFC